MKKYLLTSLLIMCQITACASEKSNQTIVENKQPITSIKQSQPTPENPYQEVFDAVAPILKVNATDIQTENIKRSMQVDANNWKDVAMIVSALENPATNQYSEMEKSITATLTNLGWQLDGSLFASGEEGSRAVFFIKQNHICFILLEYNETVTGIPLEELITMNNDEYDDSKVYFSVKVACGKLPNQ